MKLRKVKTSVCPFTNSKICGMTNNLSGRYKVRKEPSPAKRCEKMRKERKRCEKSHVLWKKSRLCYIMHIELNLDHIDVIKNECQ